MSRSSAFLLSTALVALSGLAWAPQAKAVAGSPGSCTINCGLEGVAADVMLLHFDENGHGTIAENGGPTRPLGGVLAADPSAPSSGGTPVLTYFLPEPVISGTACFSEPGGISLAQSDCLRFTDNTGAINGGVTGAGSRMIFYSDFELGELNTDLADTGFPANILAGNFLQSVEVGTEGNNGFDYRPGGVPYPGNNQYVGISDAPEPASLALLGGGLLSFGLLVRRRRSR